MLKMDIAWQRGDFKLAVALDIPPAEVVLLSGPSGSGKTTLLRLLAGLETPKKGHIYWRAKGWVDTSKSIELPAQQRNMSLIFQAYALFPHWTVAQNLAFAQKEMTDENLYNELVEACDLTTLLAHYPSQLSGGQQQRVALARSLLRKSEVLLLDEPFAAQDWTGRQRLIRYLQTYQERYQTLMIISSHDSRGLQDWADRQLYMSDGSLTSSGPAANTAAFIFLGLERIEGRLFARLQRQGQEIWWPDPPAEWKDLQAEDTVWV